MEPPHGPPGEQSNEPGALRARAGEPDPAAREAVRQLVGLSAQRLDAEDFAGYMALCAPAFHYRITAYSPEIRKDMIWLDQDRAGMEALLAMVPQHLRRLGGLSRQVSGETIESGGGGTIEAVSSVLVINTDLEGRSTLFAVGRYHDKVDTAGAAPLLVSRRVHLETRDLGIGSHVPI